MGWRYIAQRIAGPDKGKILDWNLPLRNVVLTETLGPWWLSATIEPELPDLRLPDGDEVISKWNTAIWAEQDGRIVGGGIVASNPKTFGSWSVECIGWLGYPDDLIYAGMQRRWVEEDPAIPYRWLLTHAMEVSGGLDLEIPQFSTPNKIGKKEVRASNGDVTEAEEAFEVNWWETLDMGDLLADLREVGGFEVREEHAWASPESNEIVHRVRVGVPRLGRRRTDLRFAMGENIIGTPAINTDDLQYANYVVGIGAGEGRSMVRVETPVNDGRLRRTMVIEDKQAKSESILRAKNTSALAKMSQLQTVTQIVVQNHPNAKIGSWQVGDEIRVQGHSGWMKFDQWCRIVSQTVNTVDPDHVLLDLERS